ncbi:hypothetical protein KQI63_11485 [bacterium]|nr:hypothetical protein [bacterium]
MSRHPQRTRSLQTGVPMQLRRAGLFKGFLFVGALLLTAALFLSTNLLVRQVRDSARSYLSLSVQYYRNLLIGDNPELAYEAVQGIDFPIVLADSVGNPKFWRNLDVEPGDFSPEAMNKVRTFIAESRAEGNEPLALEVVPGQVDYFHYGDPKLVTLLRTMSLVSALAVAIYILIGYVGFRVIRKAEERSVWVGMARETAHQLGTPISSLMGWVEVLGDQGEITESMKQDIGRLEKIAVRFSKIGTREKLQRLALSDVVNQAVTYMRGRVGSTIRIDVRDKGAGEAGIQPELIGWVLENLLRNATQAMEGKGTIIVETGTLNGEVYVDVIDDGRGISLRNTEAIFRPGFTTKKRGWGLGLSLGRRIVEEMHRGRLFVKSTKPGEGTTIRMVLPT